MSPLLHDQFSCLADDSVVYQGRAPEQHLKAVLHRYPDATYLRERVSPAAATRSHDDVLNADLLLVSNAHFRDLCNYRAKADGSQRSRVHHLLRKSLCACLVHDLVPSGANQVCRGSALRQRNKRDAA